MRRQRITSSIKNSIWLKEANKNLLMREEKERNVYGFAADVKEHIENHHENTEKILARSTSIGPTLSV